MIHDARDGDWPQMWPIIRDVVADQQTFAYDPALNEFDAKRLWVLVHRHEWLSPSTVTRFSVPRICMLTGPGQEATSPPGA
jgi:hypothetical protein